MFFSFSDAPQSGESALRSSFLQMSPLGCGNSHQGGFEFVKCLESIKKFEDPLTFFCEKRGMTLNNVNVLEG